MTGGAQSRKDGFCSRPLGNLVRYSFAPSSNYFESDPERPNRDSRFEIEERIHGQ